MLRDTGFPSPRVPACSLTLELPTVLLVNGHADLRRLKRLMLERANYKVVEMLDGQLALDYLRASAVPLVVVMNTRIPGLNAAGLLRAVTGESSLSVMRLCSPLPWPPSFLMSWLSLRVRY